MAASLTLALGLFSSCKDEPKKVAENTEQTEGITFRFTMPGGDAHIVDVRALHDNPEWAIDQLWMYVFDEKGETIVEDPVNIRNTQDFKFSGTEAKYTYKQKWEKDTMRQFFFVANMNINLQKGATKAQLMEKVHEKEMTSKSEDILYPNDPTLYANGQTINVTDDNGKRIPMTAFATQGSSRVIALVANAQVEVKLKRTVARIDIVNRVPGFKITKLELVNAFKKANIAEESTNALADNRLKASVEPFTALTNDNNLGKREGTAIKKAFYLYEGKNEGVAETEVTYVRITAEYNGQADRVFLIPFKAKDPATGKFTIAKDVKRNFLYTINLGTKIDPVTGAEVEFTINEEPWNAVDLEESLALIYVTGDPRLTDPSFNGITLDLKDAANNSIELKLDNDFKNHTKYETPTADVDWITDMVITKTTGNEATFTFNVLAHTGNEARVGKITLKTDASTDSFTLTVKQP